MISPERITILEMTTSQQINTKCKSNFFTKSIYSRDGENFDLTHLKRSHNMMERQRNPNKNLGEAAISSRESRRRSQQFRILILIHWSESGIQWTCIFFIRATSYQCKKNEEIALELGWNWRSVFWGRGIGGDWKWSWRRGEEREIIRRRGERDGFDPWYAGRS